MATRRRRTKKKVAKKTAKKKVRRKAATVAVPKSTISSELSLLHRIDKNVRRIDHTVNAGKRLAHKARKAARRRHLESEWEEGALSGVTAE